MENLWTILILLLCPLMMFVCMRGMSHGHTNADHSHGANLSAKMEELERQNEQLLREIQSLKEKQG